MTSGRKTRKAASSRAGAYAEGQARRLRRQWARTHWKWLLGSVLLATGPSIASAVLLEDGVARGLLIGLTVGFVTASMIAAVGVLSGSATWTLGAWAEEWTAEELGSLLDHGYELINHAGLGPGDIDHFLVGPGGVFVIETKWRGT